MRGLGSEVTSGFLPGEVKDYLSQSGAILLEKRQCEILYIKNIFLYNRHGNHFEIHEPFTKLMF
jgi:hypothetical protein